MAKNTAVADKVEVSVTPESAPGEVLNWLKANAKGLKVKAGYQEGSFIYLTDFTVNLRDAKYQPVRDKLKAAGFIFRNSRQRGPIWFHRTFGHDVEKTYKEPFQF